RRFLELVLELAGAPARVAGEDARANGVELVEVGFGRHERDVADDRHLGLGLVLDQHDDGLGLHGPAYVDELVGAREVGKVRHRVGDADRRRPREDEAHRALVVVVGHQYDGAPEVRVVQERRGDQQLALERVHVIHPTLSAATPASATPTPASWTRVSRSARSTWASRTVVTG